MSNAMKYSDTCREIALRSYRTDDHAVIEVSDSGVGIPSAEHKRIFERFYRVPSKENDRVPGTGLGLALAWHIAEGHGGHIKIQSEPNQGSTFSVWLPLEDSA
jgi:two-component system phosphate regulon sensor histidine kinase PhoR